MKQPLVSVIMSSYNHREFVEKAIESVLKQTYRNFEFIIADDGSTDGSCEVICEYDDSRIKFISAKENTAFGVLEYAYELAQGEYIAEIASDDMWDEAILEKYIEFLEKNQEYGCCFSKPEIVDANGDIIEKTDFNVIFKAENKTKEEWFKGLYIRGNCLCAASMCIRKSLYEQVGSFRFQYRQSQDYEYWLRLVQISNIYIYPEKLVKYRIHSEGENKNISTSEGDAVIRGRMERKYTLLDIMENLEDEFFIKAFESDLFLKPGTEGFCVECEKFGILLKTSMAEPAIYYYYKHYGDYEFRNCLETYYHISRKDFWQFTGVDHDKWYESMINKYKIEGLEKQIVLLQQELRTKEEEIKQLKGF